MPWVRWKCLPASSGSIETFHYLQWRRYCQSKSCPRPINCATILSSIFSWFSAHRFQLSCRTRCAPSMYSIISKCNTPHRPYRCTGGVFTTHPHLLHANSVPLNGCGRAITAAVNSMISWMQCSTGRSLWCTGTATCIFENNKNKNRSFVLSYLRKLGRLRMQTCLQDGQLQRWLFIKGHLWIGTCPTKRRCYPASTRRPPDRRRRRWLWS